jgi:hypothetical protein
MTAREAVGPLGYARARCGHCSACASNQMLRRTLPTAERTVTPVRQTEKRQVAIDKGDAIRERPAGFKEDCKDWRGLDCGHVWTSGNRRREPELP